MENVDIVAIDQQIWNIKDKLPDQGANIDFIREELNKLESEVRNSKYILQRPMQISLIGRVSTGKSSFLNKLFDCDLLPVSIGQTTKCCTEIRVHDKEEIIVDIIRKYGRSESKSFSGVGGVQDHLSDIYDSASSTDKVTISLPAEGDKYRWLKNVIVVDTPGIGNSEALNDAVVEQCSQSDVIIVVVNASSSIGDEEWNFIRSLSMKRSIAILAYLFTCLDKVSHGEMDQTIYHHKSEAYKKVDNVALVLLPIEIYFSKNDPVQIMENVAKLLISPNFDFEQIRTAIESGLPLKKGVSPVTPKSIKPAVESLYEDICSVFKDGHVNENIPLEKIRKDKEMWEELLDWYLTNENELGLVGRIVKNVDDFIKERTIWEKLFLVFYRIPTSMIRGSFVAFWKFVDDYIATEPNTLFRRCRQFVDYHSVSGLVLDSGYLENTYAKAAKWNINEINSDCSMADLGVQVFKIHYIGIHKILREIVWSKDTTTIVPKIKRLIFFTSVLIGNSKIKKKQITRDRDLLKTTIEYYMDKEECSKISGYLTKVLNGDFSEADELISSYEQARLIVSNSDEKLVEMQCFMIFTEIFVIYLYNEALRDQRFWHSYDRLDPYLKLTKKMKYSL